MTIKALGQAVSIIGSMQILADALGVTKGAVGQWKLEGRRVPAEYCPTIEKLTAGTVKCEQLRPDIDWGYLRVASSDICPASPDVPECCYTAIVQSTALLEKLGCEASRDSRQATDVGQMSV